MVSTPLKSTTQSPEVKGWFFVRDANSLTNTIFTQTLLGREIVLFLDSSGTPVALDAHCPPMGAHLGKGAGVK